MADTPRLVERATEAFVDRAPIDWPALLERSAAADRPLVETLRSLAVLRGGRPFDSSSLDSQPRFAAWLVIAIATVQAAGSFVLFAIGSFGSSARGHVPQLVLATAFATAAALLAVMRRRPGSVFLLATFVSAAAAFARSLPDAAFPAWSTAWHAVPLEILTPACLWQFAAEFPRVRRFTSFDVHVRRLAAAAWVVGAVLFFVNVIGARIALEHSVVAPLLRDHPSRFYWTVFTVAMIPVVAVIFVRARRAPLGERRRVTRFAWALAGGSAPFFLSGVAWIVLPAVGEWLRGLDAFHRISVAALGAWPIMGSVAIVADGGTPLTAAVAEAVQRAIRRGVSPMRGRRAQREQLLASAIQHLQHARGTRELAVMLANELRRAVDAKAVHVLVGERSGSYRDPLGLAEALPRGSALVPMLIDAAMPIDVADGRLLRLLPAVDRDWINGNEVRVLTPLRRRDGSVGAVVAVGERAGGVPFGRNERWFVAACAAAASAIWRDDVAAADGANTAFECDCCGLVSASLPLSCECRCGVGLAAMPQTLGGGKFLVIRRLGRGGMGVAYLARDTALDRLVALKTLPSLHPGAAMQLQDEARAMAALSHDALAMIYGIEMWQHTPVLVVEYFADGTLSDRIAQQALPYDEAVRIGARVAAALAHMHAHGRLHRDVKPGNIGMSAGGAAKLMDFGLSISIASTAGEDPFDFTVPARAPVAGTPAYMPPEAYLGGDAGPAFDVWSIAVTLLEAVSGTNPFSTVRSASSFRRVVRRTLPQVLADACDSSADMRRFFERALQWRPEDRFPDARTMQLELERILRLLRTGSDG